MADEVKGLTDEQRAAVDKFDPKQPLVIRPNEVEGLEEYMGKFVFKRGTVQDKIRIGVLHAKLRENTEVDNLTDSIAFILATFKVVCVEKPAGFEFETLPELNPLFELHERYMQWVNLFRLKVQRDKEKSGATA